MKHCNLKLISLIFAAVIISAVFSSCGKKQKAGDKPAPVSVDEDTVYTGVPGGYDYDEFSPCKLLLKKDGTYVLTNLYDFNEYGWMNNIYYAVFEDIDVDSFKLDGLFYDDSCLGSYKISKEDSSVILLEDTTYVGEAISVTGPDSETLIKTVSDRFNGRVTEGKITREYADYYMSLFSDGFVYDCGSRCSPGYIKIDRKTKTFSFYHDPGTKDNKTYEIGKTVFEDDSLKLTLDKLEILYYKYQVSLTFSAVPKSKDIKAARFDSFLLDGVKMGFSESIAFHFDGDSTDYSDYFGFDTEYLHALGYDIDSFCEKTHKITADYSLNKEDSDYIEVGLIDFFVFGDEKTYTAPTRTKAEAEQVLYYANDLKITLLDCPYGQLGNNDFTFYFLAEYSSKQYPFIDLDFYVETINSWSVSMESSIGYDVLSGYGAVYAVYVYGIDPGLFAEMQKGSLSVRFKIDVFSFDTDELIDTLHPECVIDKGNPTVVPKLPDFDVDDIVAKNGYFTIMNGGLNKIDGTSIKNHLLYFENNTDGIIEFEVVTVAGSNSRVYDLYVYPHEKGLGGITLYDNNFARGSVSISCRSLSDLFENYTFLIYVDNES